MLLVAGMYMRIKFNIWQVLLRWYKMKHLCMYTMSLSILNAENESKYEWRKSTKMKKKKQNKQTQ